MGAEVFLTLGSDCRFALAEVCVLDIVEAI